MIDIYETADGTTIPAFASADDQPPAWHNLAERVAMPDADAMIRAARECNAIGLEHRIEPLYTADGLRAPKDAIVMRYQARPDRIVGVNGARFRALPIEDLEKLIRATCDAGARPSAIMSLCEGTRFVAAFAIGNAIGIRDHFLLSDAYDGSGSLVGGNTSTRVVCANTMRIAMAEDGRDMAKIRHTVSIDENARILAAAIGRAIKSGDALRALYADAAALKLDADAARVAFDLLFAPAAEDASATMRTRSENVRHDARLAAALPINREGDAPGNLATLWNAGTYLVDREVSGEYRATRGGADAIDSLLFGARASRVAEIESTMTQIVELSRIAAITAPALREAFGIPQLVAA